MEDVVDEKGSYVLAAPFSSSVAFSLIYFVCDLITASPVRFVALIFTRKPKDLSSQK